METHHFFKIKPRLFNNKKSIGAHLPNHIVASRHHRFADRAVLTCILNDVFLKFEMMNFTTTNQRALKQRRDSLKQPLRKPSLGGGPGSLR